MPPMERPASRTSPSSVDALLNEADTAIPNRDLPAAPHAVRRVLRINPENEVALTFTALLEGEVADPVADEVGA